MQTQPLDIVRLINNNLHHILKITTGCSAMLALFNKKTADNKETKVTKVTIEDAQISLNHAMHQASRTTSRPSNAVLGGLYEKAAGTWSNALKQSDIVHGSEQWKIAYRRKIVKSYNVAASYFMKAISETDMLFDAIEKYLDIETLASGGDFILNADLGIKDPIFTNIKNIQLLLTKSITPYAAGELLLKYADKSAGDLGHRGLAYLLYKFAAVHFTTELKQNNNLSPITIQTYRKVLHGWLDIAEYNLAVVTNINDDTEITEYTKQINTIKRHLAKLHASVTEKPDYHMAKVTPPLSFVRRRSKPQ